MNNECATEHVPLFENLILKTLYWMGVIYEVAMIGHVHCTLSTCVCTLYKHMYSNVTIYTAECLRNLLFSPTINYDEPQLSYRFPAVSLAFQRQFAWV